MRSKSRRNGRESSPKPELNDEKFIRTIKSFCPKLSKKIIQEMTVAVNSFSQKSVSSKDAKDSNKLLKTLTNLGSKYPKEMELVISKIKCPAGDLLKSSFLEEQSVVNIIDMELKSISRNQPLYEFFCDRKFFNSRIKRRDAAVICETERDEDSHWPVPREPMIKIIDSFQKITTDEKSILA